MEDQDINTIITLAMLVAELALSITARFFLFKKAGIKRWKAFIPLYGDAVAYKVTNMSALWVFVEIPQLVASVPGLKIPVWFSGLANGLYFGVNIIFAIQLARAFHRKTGFMILSILLPNLMQIIVSVSKKSEYDQHYNRYKYCKVGNRFIKLENASEYKKKRVEDRELRMKNEILSEPEPPEKTGALKKFTDFIVEKHKAVLVVVLLLAAGCAFLATKVNINRDLTKYMPASSETAKGLNLMYDEFDSVLAMPLSVMVDDLSNEEKVSERDYLKNLEGVASVTYDDSEKYNKDNHTLYELTIKGKSDSDNGKNVIQTLQTRYKDMNKAMAIRGEVATSNAPVLPIWVIGLAVVCALIILIIMSDSYVEPVMYLIAIGLAVVINMGTNAFLPSVSQITNSITSVLQLALSMDYSIMLATEYHREKIRGKSKIPAMKAALSRSFTSISASSITTIVGMLVLILMSFTIGRDLGIVLAKGVLLCLFSIFTVLPALLVIFDGLIEKTRKHPFEPKLDFLGNISFKIRKFAIPIFLLIMGGAFAAQLSVGNLFTNTENDIDGIFGYSNQTVAVYDLKDSEKISEFCKSLSQNEKTTQVLCYDNTINEPLTAEGMSKRLTSLGSIKLDKDLIDIVYKIKYTIDSGQVSFRQLVDTIVEDTSTAQDDALLAKVSAVLQNAPEIKYTAEELLNSTYNSLSGDERVAKLLEATGLNAKLDGAKNTMDNAKKQLVSDHYGRVVIRTQLPPEGDETTQFIKEIKDDLNSRGLESPVYLVGNSAMAYEMSQSFGTESMIISIITAVAIYIVVAISFKSMMIPLILVLIIQTAVWITMSITGITDGNIYFLSLIIVQSLLMGATIDYAIMFTEQYVAARGNGLNVQKSVVRGYNKSIQAILTSAGVLTLVTAIVGNFASSTAAKICKTISDGTFFSTLLILLLLPALMAACDRFVIKRKK